MDERDWWPLSKRRVGSLGMGPCLTRISMCCCSAQVARVSRIASECPVRLEYVAAESDPNNLATLCFRRVPEDVKDRDVVLAALWHLLIEYAKNELPIAGRTIRHTHLGKRAGLRRADFNAALAELRCDGLIGGAENGYCLTPRGYMAVRDLLDVDRTIQLAKAAKRAA